MTRWTNELLGLLNKEYQSQCHTSEQLNHQMVSSLTPRVWIRTGCNPILNIYDSSSYNVVGLSNSDVFWVLILHPSFSLENGVSGNILCLSPWPCSPPRRLLAVLLTWRTASCSHLGLVPTQGQEDKAAISKRVDVWASFAKGIFTLLLTLDFLNFTRVLIFQNYLFSYSILSKKCWLYSLNIPLASQPYSLVLTTILVWFWKLTDLLIRYPGQDWSAIPGRLQREA